MYDKLKEIELVKKVMNYCLEAHSKKEEDSETQSVYILACTALYYLAGIGIDKEEYYSTYGNKILEFAKKHNLITDYELILDTARKKPSNISGWNTATKKRELPITAFMDVDERIRPAVEKNVNDHKEAMGIMLGVKIGGRDD